MVELIAIMILLGSVVGMGLIVYRKMPVLAELPEAIEKPGEHFWLRLRNKITKPFIFKPFSFETFLQKILSKIRILTMRIENKVGNSLQKLREDSQKKKLGNDNYWQELKKSTDKENRKLKPR